MNNRLLALAKGDLVELPDAKGATLRVTRGRLWVTQEGDRRDIVLERGDAWTVELPGLTVAEAQDDAAVVVAGGYPAAVQRPTVRRHQRLAAWLERIGDAHLRRSWVPYL